jgi:hypothetical protein
MQCFSAYCDRVVGYDRRFINFTAHRRSRTSHAAWTIRSWRRRCVPRCGRRSLCCRLRRRLRRLGRCRTRRLLSKEKQQKGQCQHLLNDNLERFQGTRKRARCQALHPRSRGVPLLIGSRSRALCASEKLAS